MADEKSNETLTLYVPGEALARIVTEANQYPKNSPIELDIMCIRRACEVGEQGVYSSRPDEFWEKLAGLALLKLSVPAPADPDTVHTVDV